MRNVAANRDLEEDAWLPAPLPFEKPTDAPLGWLCDLTLLVEWRHPPRASLSLITSCLVNWTVWNLIRHYWRTRPSNTAQPCTPSIRSWAQISRGWCAKAIICLIQYKLYDALDGKAWSGLSVWSLNLPVPLHRVWASYFLTCPHYIADLGASLWGMQHFRLHHPFGLLSSSLLACNTILSIDFLGNSSCSELTVLLWS